MTLAPSSLYRSSRPVAAFVATVLTRLRDDAPTYRDGRNGHRRGQSRGRLGDDVWNASGIAFDRANPLQIALGPYVNEAKHENQNENQHLEQRKNAAPLFGPAPENGGDGVDESHLDVEHDVD